MTGTAAAWREDRGAFFEDAPPTPFVALQRVVVRMLFDPAFVAEVYADPERTLAGLAEPRLVRQLVGNDRRLWNADPLRRRRTLKALMEELKVSTALVLVARGRWSVLDDFFGSRAFHEAVQGRGYLALAFVTHLEAAFRRSEPRCPQGEAVLALEGAMCWCRRAAREARRGRDPHTAGTFDESGPAWVAAAGVGTVAVPSGTLEVVQHMERYLFETSLVPALVLCEDAPRPEPLPPLDPAAPIGFLLEPGEGGRVELSDLSLDYHHVLAACRRPCTPESLGRALEPAGLAPGRSRELASALADAGVLRRVVLEGGTVSALPGQE